MEKGWDSVDSTRKFRELFGPEKPVVKLQSTFLEELIFNIFLMYEIPS